MRLSCTFCTINLIILAIFGGIYAFSGFDALTFLCLGNPVAVRCVLAADFVCALFAVYYMLVLKPFKGLK